MRFNIVELNQKINSLENENEVLRQIIKDELYKDFIEKLGEPDVVAKLKADNKKLRLKIKELQSMLIEAERKKGGKR